MTPFLGEVIGTALLILLGNGVVANVVLNQTKGKDSGWIVITWGWGMAVFVAVFTVAAFSGAHLNPAVSVGLAIAGKFPWAQLPSYVLAQFLGSFIGSFLVWLMYRPHFAATENTGPETGGVLHRPWHSGPFLELGFRDYRHLCAGIRGVVPGGVGVRPGRAGCVTGRPAGAGYWFIAGVVRLVTPSIQRATLARASCTLFCPFPAASATVTGDMRGFRSLVPFWARCWPACCIWPCKIPATLISVDRCRKWRSV
jgi:hypothetical protein